MIYLSNQKLTAAGIVEELKKEVLEKCFTRRQEIDSELTSPEKLTDAVRKLEKVTPDKTSIKLQDIIHQLKHVAFDKSSDRLLMIIAQLNEVYLENVDEKILGVIQNLKRYLDRQEAIIKEISVIASGEYSKLLFKGFKVKLAQIYFNDTINAQNLGDNLRRIFQDLESPHFAQFPDIQLIIREIFSWPEGHHVTKADIKSLEELAKTSKVVIKEDAFEILNLKYGYFSEDARYSIIYQALLPLCRNMSLLVERQAYDQEMAYKLMVLCLDTPNLDKVDEVIQHIAANFAKIHKGNPSKTTYHDTFVTELINFPTNVQAKDMDRWRQFILNHKFPALKVFADCQLFDSVPKNMQDAKTKQLVKVYPRAEENPDFAMFCKGLRVKNAEFESGLDFIKSDCGWPKKRDDNLPKVDVRISKGGDDYRWVKLPPDDLRALYLGIMIPGCCQVINGHSRQCVIDGTSLSDNGFYVLLKSKSKPRVGVDEEKKEEESFTDLEGDIVAQSYAWISINGNLCLDSVEWDSQRVSPEIIRELMSFFSQAVFTTHQDIKHIHVGRGGQTGNLFDDNEMAFVAEQQRQGTPYGDADRQYCLASNISVMDLESLKQATFGLEKEAQSQILYLATYVDSLKEWIEDINKQPGQYQFLFSHAFLNLFVSVNEPLFKPIDCRPLTFEQYGQLSQSEQQAVSTFRKLINCSNMSEFLQWLPTIPADTSLVAIKQKNRLGNKLLHLAAQKEDLLELVMDFIPQHHRLEAIKEKDRHGYNILHNAVRNPKKVKLILQSIPEYDRFEAIKEKDRFGGSIIELAAQEEDLLKLVLDFIPQHQRLEAIKEKGSHGDNILHKTFRNQKFIELILQSIPEAYRLEAIKEKDENGDTILHKNYKLVEFILQSIPEAHRLEAIKEKGSQGDTILHKALGDQKLIELILQSISEEGRLEAIQEKDVNGDTILHLSACNYKLMTFILDSIPQESIFEAIKLRDVCGSMVMDKLLSWGGRRHELIKLFFDKIPIDCRLALIKESPWVLSQATPEYELLNYILESISDVCRLEVIKACDTVLHFATQYPASLKLLLDTIPPESLSELINRKDQKGNTVLHLVVQKQDLLSMVLDRIPEASRLEAIIEKDANGNTALHLSISAKNCDLFVLLFNCIPKAYQLELVKEKNVWGETLLHLAVTQPPIMEILLSVISKKELLSVIQIQGRCESNVLEYAAKSSTYSDTNLKNFNRLLDLIGETEDFDVFKTKNFLRILALNTASGFKPDPEGKHFLIFKKVLRTIESSELFELLQKKDHNDATVFSCGLKNPATSELILDSIEQVKRANLIKHDIQSLAYLATDLASLVNVLKFISPGERLCIIGQLEAKNKMQFFQSAEKDPSSFIELIESLPETERHFVFMRDSLMHVMAKWPRILNNLLQLIPQDHLQGIALHREREGNNNLLHTTATQVENFQKLFESIPQAHRLEVLKTLNSRRESVLKIAATNLKSLEMIKNLLSPAQLEEFKNIQIEPSKTIGQLLEPKPVSQKVSLYSGAHSMVRPVFVRGGLFSANPIKADRMDSKENRP